MTTSVVDNHFLAARPRNLFHFAAHVEIELLRAISPVFYFLSRIHYISVAGQEGLEPPTCGFGDRRSTNWSYWPAILLYLHSTLLPRYFVSRCTV